MKRILTAFIAALLLVTSCEISDETRAKWAEREQVQKVKDQLRRELKEEAKQIDKQVSSTFYSIDIQQFTFRGHTLFWFNSGGGDYATGGPIHIPDLCPKCNSELNLKPEEKVDKVLSEYEILFGHN